MERLVVTSRKDEACFGSCARLKQFLSIQKHSLPRPPSRAQSRRWRMVTSWPKRLPGPGMSAERVAERIAALSGGRMQVTVSAAGEVVPAFEVLDAVGGGVAELGHTASFYWQGKQPAARLGRCLTLTKVPGADPPQSGRGDPIPPYRSRPAPKPTLPKIILFDRKKSLTPSR
jgi:hypothetical protein